MSQSDADSELSIRTIIVLRGCQLGSLLPFSSIIRTWSAAWVHTTSAKLAGSSALLGVESDRPKKKGIYRS